MKDEKRRNAAVDFRPPMNGPGHVRRAQNKPPPHLYVSDPYVRRLLAEWDAWRVQYELRRERGPR